MSTAMERALRHAVAGSQACVALVESESGDVLGWRGDPGIYAVGLAAGADVVRRVLRPVPGALEPVDEIVLTLGRHRHLIRPLGDGRRFLHLVVGRLADLDRAREALDGAERRLLVA